MHDKILTAQVVSVFLRRGGMCCLHLYPVVWVLARTRGTVEYKGRQIERTLGALCTTVVSAVTHELNEDLPV